MTTPRRHLLTVAVEDYYHASAFNKRIEPKLWGRLETRLALNTTKVLDLLDEYQIKATFFALGWTAERFPEIIAEIARRGHEIACKGHFHRSIDEMSEAEFRDDVQRARDAVERAAGRKVVGYRIAKGSLKQKDLWALDVLAAEGFRYDSSAYPRFTEVASQPWRRYPYLHRENGREIWEMPITSCGPDAFTWPLGGGNYFRQFPQWMLRRALASTVARSEHPLNLYFHVWELDPEVPRVSVGGVLTRIRQYRNLGKMEAVLRECFATYAFRPIAEHLGLETAQLPAKSSKADSTVSTIATTTKPDRTPVSIVIPCYNEESTVPYLANTLFELEQDLGRDYDLRFLFVDDKSRDGTLGALDRAFGQRDNCEIVRHERNKGVAAAILSGVRAAKTEVVCSIDCDCSYDPHQLRTMIPLLESDVNLVTASPYHPSGQVKNVAPWRLSLSKTLSKLYRLVLPQKIFTYTSCFRVYRRSAVVDVAVSEGGFLGVAELLARLCLRGDRIVEAPAILESRVLGYSKLALFRTILGHLRLLAQLSWERLR